jgi:hypothetical protein
MDTPTPSPSLKTADPVGLVEIASRLGLRRQTIAMWRMRHPDTFPTPRWTVSTLPAWDWRRDIVPWLIATDRPLTADEDATTRGRLARAQSA